MKLLSFWADFLLFWSHQWSFIRWEKKVLSAKIFFIAIFVMFVRLFVFLLDFVFSKCHIFVYGKFFLYIVCFRRLLSIVDCWLLLTMGESNLNTVVWRKNNQQTTSNERGEKWVDNYYWRRRFRRQRCFKPQNYGYNAINLGPDIILHTFRKWYQPKKWMKNLNQQKIGKNIVVLFCVCLPVLHSNRAFESSFAFEISAKICVRDKWLLNIIQHGILIKSAVHHCWPGFFFIYFGFWKFERIFGLNLEPGSDIMCLTIAENWK